MAYLTTKHLGRLGEPGWRVVFYFTSVSTVGSLAYSTVVFTTLLSIVLWHETLPLSSWLAMALIIVSGVLAARQGGHDQPKLLT